MAKSAQGRFWRSHAADAKQSETPYVVSYRGLGGFCFAIPPDQVAGGVVVPQGRLVLLLQLGDDAFGEDFAELNTPLIEGADIPNDALGEDIVLIERDQLAEDIGRELLGHQRVGRPIAFKGFMWDQPVGR